MVGRPGDEDRHCEESATRDLKESNALPDGLTWR